MEIVSGMMDIKVIFQNTVLDHKISFHFQGKQTCDSLTLRKNLERFE